MPFQIFQSEKSMIIAYEYAGAVRNVLLTTWARPRSTAGWASRWPRDGDILVVTVTGMLDRTVRLRRQLPPQMRLLNADLTGPGWCATRRRSPIRTRLPVLEDELQFYKHVGEDATVQFKRVEFVEELAYGDLRKEPPRAQTGRERRGPSQHPALETRK